ncbi:MAG: FAD-binding protein, partial [Myxococcota bacterium]|nr:FAD-binding protein [Myxococcota bacterium]
MGEKVGGACDHMQRISAWRFINPPFAFAQGILVDGQGRRFVNEALYGAAIGEAIVEKADGRAFLILDSALASGATKQVGRGQTHWFQTAPALLNLWFNSRKAGSLEGLATRCRMDPQTLAQSAALYNDDDDDVQRKPSEFCAPLSTPPFRAIDCSIGSKVFPLPTLTLGGLRVEESSGKVLRADNSPIEGLYAAGRAAAGICSRSYVSGLSLADCIFSGRRLAKHLSKEIAPNET